MSQGSRKAVAFVVCALVFVAYFAVTTLLGFKRGGGYFMLALLVWILSVIWKSIVGSDKKGKPNHDVKECSDQQDVSKDATDNSKNGPNN